MPVPRSGRRSVLCHRPHRVRLRSPAPTATAAARLYGQLHVLVGPKPRRVGQDRRRLFGRRRLCVQPAHDRRQRLRPHQHTVHGPGDQHANHNNRRPLRPLLHVRDQHDDDNRQRLRRVLQMAMGDRYHELEFRLQSLRRQLPVFRTALRRASIVRSRLDTMRRNEYFYVDHQHDHDNGGMHRELRFGMFRQRRRKLWLVPRPVQLCRRLWGLRLLGFSKLALQRRIRGQPGIRPVPMPECDHLHQQHVHQLDKLDQQFNDKFQHDHIEHQHEHVDNHHHVRLQRRLHLVLQRLRVGRTGRPVHDRQRLYYVRVQQLPGDRLRRRQSWRHSRRQLRANDHDHIDHVTSVGITLRVMSYRHDGA
jgi:hypothetical protein